MGQEKKRSAVYIDGFNLYYGSLRGGPHRWLNLERFFQLLRPSDDIQAIRYFTALVSGPNRARQELYLRALETLPLVQTILGRFKTKRVQCHVVGCQYTGARFFQAPEEKRTDVNIGVHLIDDAYQRLCERFILVSGDSDLVPAIHRLKMRFPEAEVIVYVPSRDAQRGAAVELRSAADKHRTLPLALLRHAHFPPTIPDGAGGTLTKPATW
jgi:hypothetical protein